MSQVSRGFYNSRPKMRRPKKYSQKIRVDFSHKAEKHKAEKGPYYSTNLEKKTLKILTFTKFLKFKLFFLNLNFLTFRPNFL